MRRISHRTHDSSFSRGAGWERWVRGGARQLLVDTRAGDVAGDAVILQRVWDRVRHTVDPGVAGRVDTQLAEIMRAAERKDVAAVARATPNLVTTLAEARPR